MEVSAKHEGSQLELALKGELDQHGAKGLLACLEQEIQRSLPMVLILDFSGVTFMDSSGIAVALRGWQRMRERSAAPCGAAAPQGVRGRGHRAHDDH